MYTYIKAPPGHTLRRVNPTKDKIRLIFSSIFITLGVAAFTSVIYPFITYQTVYAPKFAQNPSVLGTNDRLALVPNAPSASQAPTVLPEIVNTSLDYTNSDAWYGHTDEPAFDHHVYSLSIPKLRIENAVVRDDHTDLKQSLIHYPGTAQPGDLGNGVIFGHSVLPQFFNPHNYLTIFSTLHTLEPGDDIIITSGPATYTYRVAQMYVASPSDLTPLAQSYADRTLTLITCTPPGTYLKRLIVRAVLI